MKVKVVDNKQYANEMREALKKNQGFCPCKLLHVPDNLCMCKEFREQVKVGETCTCGLYLKLED